MRAFLGFAAALALLTACAGGGWCGWTLWRENARLRDARIAAEVVRARLASAHGQCEAKFAQAVAAREALACARAEATNALARAQDEVRRLRGEVARLEAARADAARRADEARARARDAAAKAVAEAAAARTRAAEERKAADEADPLGSVEALRDLLELTDKAPRRAGGGRAEAAP